MMRMRTMRQGARGQDVRDVQARLAALGFRIEHEEHGLYGPSTEEAVRAFQQRRRLPVDGLLGDATWEELVEAGFTVGDRILYLRFPFFRGDDVRAIQTALNLFGFDAGKEDGIFGERTDQAVREFQRNVGLRDDGIVGRTTVEGLRRLRPVGPGPGRAAVREGEALRTLSTSMEDARIAIDAGHGPDDPGPAGPSGTTEADASYLVAEALTEELQRRGAAPIRLRGIDADMAPAERARRANQAGAELLVSVHMNSHHDPRARGASAYYYGTDRWFSPAGSLLAELMMDELTTQLGLTDLRTHRASLPLLRETRMPAVQVEPCFITNPTDEAALADLHFRRRVAAAVADAIERFFGRQPGGSARVEAPATLSDDAAARQ